ncbi:MAG: ABC transporter ATP-binding protein/permease [Turicibacter sp.]|nr:ABC transporter ATP-binding protein/permease [Turicibacter sp.]
MESIKWIFGYAKRWWIRITIVVLMIILATAVSVYIPLLTGRVVDEVINGGQIDLLPSLLLGIVGATVIREALRYSYRLLSETVGQNAIFQIKDDLYNKMQELDVDYFKQNQMGDIMARMTGDTETIRHFLSWVCYNIVENSIFFIIAIFMLARINLTLTLAILCVTPFMAYFAKRLCYEVRPTFGNIRESFSRLNSMVKENISGNRIVKVFVNEDYEIEKFRKHNRDFREKNIESASVWGKYLPLLDGLTGSLQVIIMLLGGWFIMRGEMTMGEFVAYGNFMWMLSMPMRMSGWLLNDTQRYIASSQKIQEMLKVESTIQVQNPVEKPVEGDIQFKNVNFFYQDDLQTKVLHDINLEISKGQKVAILGETGSGKSTLVSMISRFYDPTDGDVFIDGENVKKYDLKTLRGSIANVMQDVFLFSDSVRQNIAFSAPDISREKIVESAMRADAHNFVMKLEDQYDTIIGERGTGLSGGQKQRVSLARALLKEPSILILDDTTSAVDMETEFKIQEELKKIGHGITTIVIASRVSSAIDADQIFVMENGRIVERGNHAGLLDKKGYYYDIYQSQMGEFLEGRVV